MAKLKLKSGQEIEIEAIEGHDGSVDITATEDDVLNYLLRFKPSGYIR